MSEEQESKFTHHLHISSDVTLLALLEDLNGENCTYLVLPHRGDTWTVMVGPAGYKVARSEFMFITPLEDGSSGSPVPQSPRGPERIP